MIAAFVGAQVRVLHFNCRRVHNNMLRVLVFPVLGGPQLSSTLDMWLHSILRTDLTIALHSAQMTNINFLRRSEYYPCDKDYKALQPQP